MSYDYRGGGTNNGTQAWAQYIDDLRHGRTIKQQNRDLLNRAAVVGTSAGIGALGHVYQGQKSEQDRLDKMAAIPQHDADQAAAMWAHDNAIHAGQDAGRTQGNQGAMDQLPVWMSPSAMKPGDASIANSEPTMQELARMARQTTRDNSSAQGATIAGYHGDPQEAAMQAIQAGGMASPYAGGMQSSLPRVAQAQPTWGTQLAPGQPDEQDQALLQSPEEFQ